MTHRNAVRITPIWVGPTAALLAILAGLALVRAQAGPSLTMSAGPGSATVSVTNLEPDNTFNGFDITLSFDASLASVTGVTGADSWNVDLVPPAIDNAAGTVRVVGISLAPSCETGCALFTVNFAPNGSGGPVAVSVAASELATSEGGEITPAPGGSTPGATVPVGPGSATPTPTATPTSTATATPTETVTSTPTASPTATPTATTTATVSPTAMPTETATATPTSTATAVPTETPTASPTEEPTAEPDTFTYELSFRWTLLTWYGTDGATVADALHDIMGNLTAVYGWNNGQWLGFFPDGIGVPGANDLASLEFGQAYWIAIDEEDGITWPITTDDAFSD